MEFSGKNTGVGSLSLLQRIFLTQELKRCVLHCRRILYQLSYQGSPYICMCVCVCVYIYTHMYIVAVVQLPSCVLLFVTPWTAAYQAPLSMGFSKQECWMGCHFLLQGIFPDQGLNLCLLHLLLWQADSLPLHHWATPIWEKRVLLPMVQERETELED